MHLETIFRDLKYKAKANEERVSLKSMSQTENTADLHPECSVEKIVRSRDRKTRTMISVANN